MKKLLFLLALLTLPATAGAQDRGTPSVIRVNIDANGYIAVIGGAQTLPLTTCLFSNCRLAVDSSGNLQVVIVGGTFTGNFYGPDGTCLLPTYSFTSDTSQGLAKGCLIVKQGTITADSQAISTTATWNNAAVTFTHWKANVTDTASNTASKLIDLQVGGNSQFQVRKSGAVWVDPQGGSTPGTDGLWIGSNITQLNAPGAGQLLLTNSAGTDFSRLQFGGTTSSFPAVRRTNTFIDILLADASNFSEVRAAGFNLQPGTGSGFNINTIPIISVTNPTIASGGCTSPTVTSIAGTARFIINIGTSCTGVKTFTLTLPATTTGWSCSGDNHTSDAAQQTNYIVSRSTSTTAVVVTSYDRVTGLQEDFTASDTYLMSCR